MTELTNLQHRTSERHVELGNSRINRDDDDSDKIAQWFNIYGPLVGEDPSLRCLYSGLTASNVDNINCDQTELIGKEINMKLDVVVTDATIKRKDQIRTLECLK